MGTVRDGVYYSKHKGDDIDNLLDKTVWQSNHDLLDNSYFVGGGSQQGGGQFPINQRGGYIVLPGVQYWTTDATYQDPPAGTTNATYKVNRIGQYGEGFITINNVEYWVQPENLTPGYTGAGYGIDRWATIYGSYTPDNDGLSVVPNSSVGFFQALQNIDRADLVGKTLTASILCNGNSFTTCTGVLSGSYVQSPTIDGGYIRFIWDDYRQYITVEFVFTRNTSIQAVKLELGDKQTLAHQENGVWVLNEVPNYQEQLARCQRYQITSEESMYYAGRVIGEHDARFTVPSPVTMRSTPRIEVAALGGMGTINGYAPITELAVVGKSSQGILINAKTISSLEGNTPITVVDSNFLLDANL